MSNHTYNVTVKNSTEEYGNLRVFLERLEGNGSGPIPNLSPILPGNTGQVQLMIAGESSTPQGIHLHAQGNVTERTIPLSIESSESDYNVSVIQNGDLTKWDLVFNPSNGAPPKVVTKADPPSKPVNVTVGQDEPPVVVPGIEQPSEETLIVKRKLETTRILLLSTVTAAWLISPTVSEFASVYLWLGIPIASMAAGIGAWLWRKGKINRKIRL